MRTPRGLRVAAVVAAATILAACAPAGTGVSPSSPVSAISATAPAPTPQVSVPVAPATLPPPAPQLSPPARLELDDLDVDMAVVPVGVQDDGSMEIPEDPAVAGWYRYGAHPSAIEGSTVLAAHVDSRRFGLGPLSRLREAQPGATVEVSTADGSRVAYTVESVTYMPRAELPVDTLFARSGPRSLVLITCGGSFDPRTRTYSDNVVLVARASP